MADTHKEPVSNPPLSLGSGSYDVEKLYGDADKALKIKDPAEREAALQKAIDDNDKLNLKDLAANTTPGYETRAVKNEALGIVENIQVPSHDPKSVDVAEEAKVSGVDLPGQAVTPAPKPVETKGE